MNELAAVVHVAAGARRRRPLEDAAGILAGTARRVADVAYHSVGPARTASLVPSPR